MVVADIAAPSSGPQPKPARGWRRSRGLRRLWSDPASRLGAAIVAFLTLVAVLVSIDESLFGRAVVRSLLGDPYTANLANALLPPSLAHPFGTDNLGRDELARVLYGSRTSMTIGVASIAGAFALGVTIGTWSAFLGGWADEVLMRAMDILLTLPAIILALGFVGILGPGLFNIIVGIGVVNVPIFARLARGSALRVKQLEFVDAARASGDSSAHIVFSEILPNCATPLIIQVSFSVALAIIWEASISFLGLGVQPPIPSWGLMLSDGKQYLDGGWWLSVFPGLAIVLTTLGFNLFGNGLRDALDPKYEVRAA